MKTTTPAVLALCLIAAAGCQATTVRGPAGEGVTTTTPRSLTIHRGSSVPLEIGIDRENFSGPVTVSLAQLPDGVTVDDKSQTVETTSATFVLRASRDAALVRNQAVSVTVEGRDDRRATQYFDLTVLE